MVDQLIDQHEQLSAQLNNHLEAEKSILLKPEYENFKHLIDTLRQEEEETSKIYNVLKNWIFTMERCISSSQNQETA